MAATALAAALVTSSALATNYNWFGNDNTPGGSGDWNTTQTNFGSGTNSSNRTWRSGSGTGNNGAADDVAIFGGTAPTGSDTYTVRLVGPAVSGNNAQRYIYANGLTFNTTGYNITADSYNYRGTSYHTQLWLTSYTSAGTTYLPTITTATNVNATISAVITGTAGMTKTGDGTLVLSGANTYTGTTTVSDGTLVLANASGTSLSDSSSININGGTLSLTTNETVAGVTLTSGSIVNTSASTPRTLTSTSGFTVQSGTVSANLGGSTSSVGLTKTTTGTVTLAGTNSYTGTTTVSAGTLVVSGSIASGSAVTVASGAYLDVTGTGNVYGATTVNGTLYGTGTLGSVTLNSGGTITGGDVGTIGELNIGTLTLNGGTYTFDFSSSGSDLLDVGTLTLSGTVLVSLNWLSDDTTLSSLVSGTKWTLIDTDIYVSASTGSYKLDASDLGSYASYFSLSTTEGGDLILTYANVPEPATYAALLGLGTLGFAGVRRWRSKRRAS